MICSLHNDCNKCQDGSLIWNAPLKSQYTLYTYGFSYKPLFKNLKCNLLKNITQIHKYNYNECDYLHDIKFKVEEVVQWMYSLMECSDWNVWSTYYCFNCHYLYLCQQNTKKLMSNENIFIQYKSFCVVCTVLLFLNILEVRFKFENCFNNFIENCFNRKIHRFSCLQYTYS